MATKLAPDWYCLTAPFVEGGEIIYDTHHPTEKEAKETFAKLNKIYTDFEEDIFTIRCLPPGEYFVGDPIEVIEDYENSEWPADKNDVLLLDDGTYFALFKAALGPGKYHDEVNRFYETKSGDFIIYPLDLLDEEKCWDLAEEDKAHIFEFEFAIDVGYDRQCEGCIDFGPVFLFTGKESWLEEEVEN
tara:strand:- start:2590 stop:3153 length:564 start_codon:yes stop_codon:yes gene_type:complete